MPPPLVPQLPAMPMSAVQTVPRAHAERGFVTCDGTRDDPRLTLWASSYSSMPNTSRTYGDWAKALPGRIWDPSAKRWILTGLGADDPAAFLASAGLGVRPGEGDYGPADLASLCSPVASVDGRIATVRHRLGGFDRAQELLGLGATWDAKRRCFTMPISEIIDGHGRVRAGVEWPEQAVAGALAVRAHVPVKPEYAEFARACAAAIRLEPDDAEALADWFSLLPDWFGLDLYGYQRYGALAVALGHSLLADSPGVGKCVTAETRVLANGEAQQIGALWGVRGSRTTPDFDGVGEVVELRPGEIEVPTLGGGTISASHLYRQRYRGAMHRVGAGGAQIECSPAHRLLTPGGWVRADHLRVGDRVRTQGEDAEVRAMDAFDFDGFIYDLTVPEEHCYVAEGLWTHNTRTALAAASIRGARRTVILAPPLVLLNWKRNVEESRLHDHGGALAGEAIALVGSSKKVQHPPEEGVFVVADSTVAARPELVEELRAWAPDAFIYDEAHRAMTMGSKRSDAALAVAGASKFPIVVTGTPMFASPHQMVTLLEMSRHLGPVFGGRDAFLSAYCTQDRFGGFRPKRRSLPDLNRKLAVHVWTRRLKADVLPELPAKFREELPVQVPLKSYKEAHQEVEDAIDEWIDTHVLPPVLPLPIERQKHAAEQIAADYCQTNLGHVSRLREAAGLCKVPVAVEAMAEHDIELDEQKLAHRPLIVWAHHKSTIAALAEAARKKLGGQAEVAVIDGSTSPVARQRIVDEFQAGKVGILIAGITAAGVGITLTRSEDMIFVESDWTPANVTQAEDRAHRIGSQSNLHIRTLVAEGTLDHAIQSVLYKKGLVLGAVTGGDVEVASAAYADASVADILAEIVQGRLRAHPQLRRLWR